MINVRKKHPPSMLFNSFEFAIFLPIVFFFYWLISNKGLQLQNIFLLVASYFFYGWWDWRFLFLLLLSTFIDYSFGLAIYNSEKRKKLFLWLSVVNNLAILGFFKYYNFFALSTQNLLGNFGLHVEPYILNIILPIGISFYTFHGMSYVFDIYNGKVKPTKNFIEYSLFVCFFPLLVAGPIERATHLLPQLQQKRNFSFQQSVDGLRQILWGLFKKIAIADNCAPIVKEIFGNYAHASGIELILGAVFFAFQIYGDFSGYSDIALGTAKLFGIELLINFRSPYFARDIAEFWRKWHISLTTWFRDYLYIPLGGSKVSKGKAIRNTFIIFLVSGFWHGANWTFIIWGLLNAIYFLPLLLTGKNRKNLDVISEGRIFPSLKELCQILTTFLLTCIAWVFFRAETVSDAFGYFKSIFANKFLGFPTVTIPSYIIYLLMLFVIIDYNCRTDGFEGFAKRIKAKPLRYGMYYAIALLLIFWGSFKQIEFIYFQF
jgi:alginate O-acetyltransferase complex protein AlgI